jgi:hypothetical protein
MKKILLAIFTIALIGIVQSGIAQEAETGQDAELAKKLANPISSLISLPFQNNTDLGIGPNNGSRYTLNIQPVVPIKLSSKVNLIARWVQPIISQFNISGVNSHESGLGDAVVSAFLSPAVSKGGFTWGAGPVFLIPDGTHDFLTTKKLGIGPTAVALLQSKGYTFGALINQIWSVAGDENRGDVSQLFFQPFFNYNWKSGAGLGANFEVTQNWEANTTTVWLNPIISAVTSLGKQKTQLSLGPRFNLAAPDGSKAKFGIRAVLVFLFPN